MCYFERGKIRPRPEVRRKYEALLTELALAFARTADPVAVVADSVESLCEAMQEPRP